MSIDWSDPAWGTPGQNVTIGSTANDARTASEDAAEAGRG